MTRTAAFFRLETAPRDFRSWLYALALGLALLMPIVQFGSLKLAPKAAAESGYRVSDNYKTDAYGVELATIGTTDNSYLFMGEELYREVGHLSLRARMLNQVTGRFSTADSFEGFSPEFWNSRYGFVSQDPANRIDPSGHFDLSIVSFGISNSIQGVLSHVPIVKHFFPGTGSSVTNYSPELVEFIKGAEGFQPNLYDNDGSDEGNTTIGYGYKVHGGPIDGRAEETQFLCGVDKPAAHIFLIAELDKTREAVAAFLTTGLSQGQFDAVIDYAFNRGSEGARGSTFIKMLNLRQFIVAANQLGSGSDGGVAKRRAAEKMIFLYSIYPKKIYDQQ